VEFLAFPIAGLGALILWAAGFDPLTSILLGPTLALGIFAVAIQLLWPNAPRKKPPSPIRIKRSGDTRRSARPGRNDPPKPRNP
jgi:hypothetical protein